MKKHIILTPLLVFAVMACVQSRTPGVAEQPIPVIRFDGIPEAEQFVSFHNRDYDQNACGDCDKCYKGKKSKRHCACGQPGKHYGKHKHRGKHQGACRSTCCEYRRNRDCEDDDRWSERSCRDNRGRDDRWGDDNRRDRRGDDDRRFTSTRGDRDDQYRGSSRSSQRKVVTTGQVKTNRPGTARRPGSRPTGSRQ